MLKKVNDLYHNLLYENVEDPWIRSITKDNEFYKEYLVKLSKDNEIQIVKARLNTFRFIGTYKNVISALKDFKVDERYWDKSIFGKDFCIYSPMVSFGEIVHEFHYDEGYTIGSVESNSVYAFDNKNRVVFEGRWYELTDLNKDKLYEFPVRAKCATPDEAIKMIDALMELQGRDKDNTIIIFEFVLNCENLANQVYDEESIFVPEQEVIEQPELVEPTAKSVIPQETEKNPNSVFSKVALVNTYDKKNQFKKTVKEVK